jgi:ketosteroid isomerase-like protein
MSMSSSGTGYGDVVRHVYDRFMRGDVPGVLAAFEPSIEFRLAEGHPYQPDGAPWIGGEAITRHFFMRAGTEWQDWTIVVHNLLDLGRVVVVEGRYNGVFTPTGRTLDVQICHVWTFSDAGKVASFHQYLDTAHLQRVMDLSSLT